MTMPDHDGRLSKKDNMLTHGGPVDLPGWCLRTAQYPRADRKEQGPAFIPVSVSGLPESRGTTATAAGEPVSLYLPGGIRLCCRAAQLADVFRELRHDDI